MTNYQIKAYRNSQEWTDEKPHVAFAETPKRSLAMAIAELMAIEHGFAEVFDPSDFSRQWFPEES